MILTDLATVTGPAHRRVRVTFLALLVVSTALQTFVAVALIPFLRTLLHDGVGAALPWLAAMTVAFLVSWLVDGVAMRCGLRLGIAVMEEVERSGVAAIRALDVDEVHSDSAARLRRLVSTAGPESTSTPALLVAPTVQASLLVPLLGLALVPVAWQLGLAVLVCGTLLLAAAHIGRRASARTEQAYSDAEREVESRALEYAWAQPTIRSVGADRGRVDEAIDGAHPRGPRVPAWGLAAELTFGFAMQISLLVVGVVTGYLYLGAELSGIEAAALVVVAMRIIDAASGLQLLSTPLAAAERTLAELAELVRARRIGVAARPHDSGPDEADEAGSAPSAVALDAVDFTFPDGTRAIDAVSLEAPAGSVTVVVGGSGSGKSTLLELVAGLREPDTGSICFDGRRAEPAERLAATSVVFQDTRLRPGTIGENIAAGAGPLTERAELDRIARDVGLGDVAGASVTSGVSGSTWELSVGEGGAMLSGGERQRVGLARAMAKPAGLLLLDEVTSALDPGTERVVIDAISTLRGERTIIAATHRPAIVALADIVLVLEDGRIVERGPAEELRSRGGRFATLWNRWLEAEAWTVTATSETPGAHRPGP